MKKNRLLTVNEIAALLNTPKVTVLRWAYQGKIPCKRHRKDYLFSKNEIIKWARTHHLSLENQNKTGTPGVPAGAGTRVLLSDALQNGGMVRDLPGKDIYSILRSAVDRLPLPAEADRTLLLEELLNREEISSTGIGRGIAIPHPRHPLGLGLQAPLVSLMYPAEPADFNAVDHHPVFCLFLMLSPGTSLHLQLLSQLSLCIQDKEFYTILSEKQDLDRILSRIRYMEKIREEKEH